MIPETPQNTNTQVKNASPCAFGIQELRDRRLKRISEDNSSRLGLFRKIYTGTHTRNQAIKGFCLDCMGFDSVAIRECGDHLCSLHKFRPFQGKAAA